jgi:hypothetical protein
VFIAGKVLKFGIVDTGLALGAIIVDGVEIDTWPGPVVRVTVATWQ